MSPPEPLVWRGVSLVHRPGKKGFIKRASRQLIYKQQVYDPDRAETVCTTTKNELEDWLLATYEIGDFFVHWVPDIEKGLVLRDPQGGGARDLGVI